MNTTVREIPIAQLTVHPDNPRVHSDKDRLDQFAHALANGGRIEEPLEVVAFGGRDQFAVISGSRRLAAATIAKLQSVPCVVKELQADEIRRRALAVNLHRDDLSEIEKTEALVATFALDIGTVQTDVHAFLSKVQTLQRNKKLEEIPALLHGPDFAMRYQRFVKFVESFGWIKPSTFIEHKFKMLSYDRSLRTLLITRAVSEQIAAEIARMPEAEREALLKDLIAQWKNNGKLDRKELLERLRGPTTNRKPLTSRSIELDRALQTLPPKARKRYDTQLKALLAQIQSLTEAVNRESQGRSSTKGPSTRLRPRDLAR
jgi:hypothetical protein